MGDCWSIVGRRLCDFWIAFGRTVLFLAVALNLELVFGLGIALLINKITPKVELIRDYQRNFYQFGGIREIWQSNDNCIEYDKELIYVPKKSSCDFNNIEFKALFSS